MSGQATAARMAPVPPAPVPEQKVTPSEPKKVSPLASVAPTTPPAPPAMPANPLSGLPGEGEWGSLSFQEAKDNERAPDSDIYTDHTVAPLAARMMAGVYDAMVMLAAFGLMAIAYMVMTRNLGADPWPESGLGWAVYAILMGAVVVFYRSLFVLAGGDSPGMRWAGLRLVTFDGDTPTERDRFQRVFWGTFSLLPLGLGLFWALVDQERLTWHDLLSKTFPSPDAGSPAGPRWSR